MSGHVYILQSGDADRYKIGFAKCVAWRIAELQSGNPEVLTLIVSRPGRPADERALHRRLEATNCRGEWFVMSPALAEIIATMRGTDENAAVDVRGAESRPARRPKRVPISAAARALAEIIAANDSVAADVRSAFHRTTLWKFATGRSRPDADSLGKLHQLTGGRVAAGGWSLSAP